MTVGAAADEELLLALLNTTRMVGGAPTDRLAEPDGAAAWLREQQWDGLPQDIELLRSTRDTLQSLVRGGFGAGSGMSGLAPAVKGVSYRARLADDGIDWELVTPPANALVARAVLAWSELQQSAPGRLRACQNTAECTRFLIDHSKSNSARWCSMAACGNRMKARRHYQRQKSALSNDLTTAGTTPQ
ncbi:CGNR zinc finger domain-containing protein [Microlunatus endophyticus]|uniref:CGNR zinc finger domain-containing protein n=1 Tax=Microlunatus endophyticus TaxID=1716077 RepID=UPI001E38BE46|nr:CGNR zinc finger domain-containing protein [Microlunatus endophyticus]